MKAVIAALFLFISQQSFAGGIPMPITCIGAESGVIASFATYKCMSAMGQPFTITIAGVELSAILAANISVGFATGPIQRGSYEMNFRAGAYKGVGGTIISGGNVHLLGAGLGLGVNLSFGVPADSMFGGQLVIE
jgi:hypothetical protein